MTNHHQTKPNDLGFWAFALISIVAFAFLAYITEGATSPDLEPSITSGVSEIKSK